MTGYEMLRDQVAEYSRRYGGGELLALEISEVYDQFPEHSAARVAVGAKWPQTWPHVHRAGVYVVFGDDLRVLYVGRSRTLGVRLGKHFETIEGLPCQVIGQWPALPRYVVTIAVPLASPWEAASLEEFLIHHLDPLANKVGRRPAAV